MLKKYVTEKISKNAKGLSTPEKHQLKIAKSTMGLNCLGARLMGGMSHYEAASTIHKLTGAVVSIDSDCTCNQGRA